MTVVNNSTNAVVNIDIDTNIGSLSGTGPVSLGADHSLTLGNLNAVTDNISGVISGTGTSRITKVGVGTLTLSGNNNYPGGTTITGGIIDVRNDNALGTGAFTFFGGGTTLQAGTNGLNLDNGITLTTAGTVNTNGNNLTLSGVIQGGGPLTVEDSGVGGNLTLSNNNTYTGDTTINGGMLTFTGSTANLTGNIANNAALVFNQAADSAFPGVISGGPANPLTKAGAGNLSLSGNSTYTGPTNINGGTLTNFGTLTSPVFVNAGGTYRGTGSTTGALTNNGIVAPGNGEPIGTLTSGNYTGTGALQIQLKPDGSSDLLAVNGTGTGTATLTNTHLEATTFGSTNKTFTILTATGGLGGTTFKSFTLPPGLTATIRYLTNLVQIATGGTEFASLLQQAQKCNAVSIAQYLDQIDGGNTESADLVTVLSALSNAARQGIKTLCAALNQISPDPYREFGFLSFDQTNLVNQSINTQQQRILDRFSIRALALDNIPSTRLAGFQNHLNTRSFRGGFQPIRPTVQYTKRPQKGVTLLENALAFNGDNLPARKTVQAGHSSIWIEPYGQKASKKNSFPLAGTKSNTYGMTLGGDTRVAPNTYVGILGGIMNTNFDWTQSRGKGRISGYYGGVYALWLSKPGFYVDGQVIVGGNKYRTRRNINFQTINRTARERHSGLSVSTDAEVGYLLTIDKTVVQPFFNYAYVAVHESSFNETGAMSLNIHSPSKTSQYSRMELGPIVSHFFVCGETLIYPSLKLSWVQKRPLGSKGKGVRFNFTDQSFGTTVFGDNRVQNLISPAISLTAQFKEGLYVTGDLNGEFGKKEKLGQAILTFGYSF